MPSGGALKIHRAGEGRGKFLHEPQLGSLSFSLSNSAVPPPAGTDLTHGPAIGKSSTSTISLARQA